MKTSHHGQMSESFLTAVFLSLSGGLQDAYTYLFRGKVFANAQTGNIVLLSANLMDGNWERVLHYLVPLCAFALGVLTAEKMRERFREMRTLHWRQLVVLGEGLLLFLVGFLPQEQNLLANAIVSFACAMQVQAFRKVNGYAFASTMCIGDLRSGVEAFCIWRKKKKRWRWPAGSAIAAESPPRTTAAPRPAPPAAASAAAALPESAPAFFPQPEPPAQRRTMAPDSAAPYPTGHP
jgi:uncharacterized membrane protein YoaK (UPF0700 family)